MCDDCRKLSENNSELAEKLSGAMHTVLKLGQENVGLKNELRRRAADDPAAMEIRCVLENWMHLCRGHRAGKPGGRKPDISEDSKRWRVVKAALKHHTLAECLEAIEGLAAMAYVSAHGRSPDGVPSQRYDDVEYALKDETVIERCRKYRARMLGASERALFDAWMAACATESLYFTAWSGKRARDSFAAMPEYKQVAHKMRVAEAADAAEQARVIDINTRRDVA